MNLLKPGDARPFSDYASQVFLPYITAQSRNVQRVDVVWDAYVHGSLKEYTRSSHGKGSRRRVEASNAVQETGKSTGYRLAAEVNRHHSECVCI